MSDPLRIERHATTMPRRRKSPWAIVIVVLATMTEARLASSGACPRRSQALTASPPMAAGVVRLKASPASRDANRARKATPSRRQAKLEPAAPSQDHSQHAERDVRDLDQELLFQVQPRVGVREEEAAADRAKERKDERGPRDAEPTRADRPFEET